MVRKRSLASVLYEDGTSSDRNRNSRNRSISNILGEESTSNQPSSSSRLVLCNCPKCNGRLIDPRTKVIHDLSNESSEISIESFQNQQEIEKIDESSSSKSTTLTQDVNLLEIEKDDIPNLTFLPRIRPKRHTNQPISVEISNIIADDEVLNISSEDEMEEMEEISIESEEESADEFSNIFEDYSSPNYDPDELIDPKSTNNNSYLWILLWIIHFIKLLLSEIGNSEFDTFPNSIYMTKKELGLRDDFYFFPTCPKCHKLYNKQEVEDYKENDTNSIMKCRHVEFSNSATRRNRQCQTILSEQVPTMDRFKLKFKLVYPFAGIRQQLMAFYNRPNFENFLRHWLNRTNSDEILSDIYDVSLHKINHYLAPIVDELESLWNGIILNKTNNCPNGKKIRAALILVSCDVPAARKICGHISALVSCHRCEKKANYENRQHNFAGMDDMDNCDPNTNNIKVLTCDSCKKLSTRFSFPYLSPIPEEINSVSLHLKKHLSSVFLHCSLGRAPNSNAYSEYRSLTGTINYSRNIQAHTLYSGTIGAFLEPTNNNNSINEFNNLHQNPILQRAAIWLTRNNSYLDPYTNILLSQRNSNINNSFLQAQHIETDINIPPINIHEIIISNNNFPDEVHNEDFHYTRLMAGFIQENDTLTIPISHNDPNLELLLFPDLFTDSKGHFYDITNQQLLNNNNNKEETYRKYIKQRLMNYDLSKIFPLLTFIRTGDSYFHEKQLHLNAILKKLGLLTLFITLKRYKKSDLTQFGEITNFFDRVEFQNCGVAHTHSCYWTTNSIELIISNNVIHSTIPDSLHETELYNAVITHQIHTCNEKCQDPAPFGQTCKKGFPRSHSETTHYKEENCRYIYKCLTEADSWVVPYHASILLIWNVHINIQYITNKEFAKYIVKYITKREPSHIFNIQENDTLREHIIARRLGSMELMFLLLGHQICNSSITVKFLTTEPPTLRTCAILPIYMINETDENPYYDDTIIKYFYRPHLPEFNNLTYFQYYEKYSITPSSPTTSRQIYRDELNNYIVKRTKEIITQYRFLKIEDSELYFYQQLLLNVLVRNESDYRIGTNGTYCEKFLSMFLEFHPELYRGVLGRYIYETSRECTKTVRSKILDRLLHSFNEQLPTNLSNIIQIQLQNLKILPYILPKTAILELSTDQYHVLSTITMHMGKNSGTKWPYYFITGSAGTGKSYLIHMIQNHLRQKNSNYLLLAPTGMAAQNIEGKTIHILHLHVEIFTLVFLIIENLKLY
ncbi:hypothetical protein Glove_122g28 [Diversispora epigaea]|uniref:ATP-dependent DNA helicase n=1 Tax=Diversispora epigaea TaxID=1348612 RepID=A0A397J1R0_9GLOM|nr:hypothetical protein Glove_122g28 [Diversispora epigaea]